MASVPKRESENPLSERDGHCRAITRKGEPCRRKALEADGLCLVHNGSQNMRELGRLGGRAIPKAKRKSEQRESLRDFLRREVDPADVWAAIQSSLASSNDRDRLAGAKLLLSELYEPAAEKEREREHEEMLTQAKEKLAARLDELAARREMRSLIDRGLVRPGGGKPFEGVVVFDLRELAEWAGRWASAPVTVTDVDCGACGRPGVRLVKEGEAVTGEAVYCETCELQSTPGRNATLRTQTRRS